MNTDLKLFRRLSKRENEVLHWVSVGKTYWEISLILGIKEGTVKFHMGNVVHKLGVRSAKQAIRASVELEFSKSVGGVA
ncbi:helix-turn-helix transcriptional regulator (plasmid) [Arsenophonus nasoniae]|uniref:Helix-turn-helix transcriptional regulator n=1 Tax=Arsenophonus nasoniae TaxID=638 RepID=A0A4P7LAM2_9GAMM|nr:helix-turn-helix transcriptional regulator [Arsenophonus nasoniae]QBY46858.1 Transcriptional activator protein EsaR [Arsenophonus nasoniae]WGM08474.1 helix-turn-helix transcriptional regulator [Arsenophonus nasoniae]WGM13905.1 helix-turn-helix transcriptional regulator [Arsenophonus nasoniae]WGM18199.1 helix-turn-helix transcriptional regulator [Arsenophonus nasoniae]